MDQFIVGTERLWLSAERGVERHYDFETGCKIQLTPMFGTIRRQQGPTFLQSCKLFSSKIPYG